MIQNIEKRGLLNGEEIIRRKYASRIGKQEHDEKEQKDNTTQKTLTIFGDNNAVSVLIVRLIFLGDTT